jgi:endonuclease III
VRLRDLREICRILKKKYGNPRHGNPRDPLDDLIYIILSTRTRSLSFEYTFEVLKEAFPNWNRLSQTDRPKLERILIPGGLGKLKSRQILSICKQLRTRFDSVTLAPLAQMSDREAEAFLTSLPGVGPKIAKCVLMYTLNRQVLPVDVHVHRVATRLGFRTKKRPDTSQDLIEDAVPRELRYSFHVNAVEHGRRVCFGRQPDCDNCPILRYCKFYLQRKRRSKK